MQVWRRHLRLLTWIALIAVWALAFVPTLSRWSVQRAPNLWAEICSINPGRVVALVAPADRQDHAPSLHADHCPLCSIHHHLPVLPTPDATARVATAEASFLPALFHHAPRPLHAWAAIQARAPPVLS